MKKLFTLLGSTLVVALSGFAQIPGTSPGDLGSVSFTYNGQQVTYTTVRAGDGSIWLQQNLGAERVANAMDDQNAYGHLFQWGRWDDGHQLRNSATSNVITISANNPSGIASGNPYFIINSTNPVWWTSDDSRKTDTWSADPPSVTNGKDPCAALGLGWRMPDSAMWASVKAAEGITNVATGFSSRLKLTRTGYRNATNGSIVGPNNQLYMVNSHVSDKTPWYFYDGNLANYWVNRGYGGACRCVYVPLCDGKPTGGKVNSTQQSVCNGDGFELSLTDASALTNITYQWQERPLGANDFSDIAGATNTFLHVLNFQQTTEFRCKVTCASSMDSSYSDTLAVAILSLPIDLGADTSICDGDVLTLDAGIGGPEYEWSNGANNRTINVSDEDTYWARISNSEGCIGTDTIKVAILNEPSASGIEAKAFGLTYAFSVAEPSHVTSYEWDFGDGEKDNAANPVHTYAAAGTYKATVMLGNKCDSVIVEQNITVTDATGIGPTTLLSDEVGIYPNPAKDVLHIAASPDLDKAGITIFSIEGKEKIHKSISAGETIAVATSDWAAGIYIIRIVSDSGTAVRKIVVE